MTKKYTEDEHKHTEKRQLSEEFPETTAEEDSFLSEAEWNNMPEAGLLQTPGTEAFLQGITGEHGGGGKIRRLRGWSVAAAVLLFAGLATIYFYRAEKQPAARPVADLAHVKKLNSAGASTITIRNSQSRIASYQLSDGSVVLLSPQSAISYLPQFEKNKRDVKLDGEAVFEVAKDASRPFTVFCKEVETVALGTKFRVSMLRDSGRVSVVLLEGKILVNSTSTAYNGHKYYLLPGNEIEYNRKSSRFTLNRMQAELPTEIAIATPSDKEPAAATETRIQVNAGKKLIRFNDVGMAKVLNVIAGKYGVSIAYPTVRINDIRFVGTLNENDPVEKILKDITSMNSLTLSFDSVHNRYTIH